MDALLSIRPKYVDRIISGEKKYEFRKKYFKQQFLECTYTRRVRKKKL
jgi:predicted transcriptional regulator